MLAFERLAEEKIREAIAAGEFDNLSTKGKPIPLDDYSSLHPEQRLTSIVLKNSGFMPPHLQYRRELEQEVEALQRFREHCCEKLGMQLEALDSARAAQPLPSINKDSAPKTLIQKILLFLHQGLSPAPGPDIKHLLSAKNLSNKNTLRCASIRRAYLHNRRWMRARLLRLALNAECTAHLLEDMLIEKETREHKPYILLLGVPFISAKEIVQEFDFNFPVAV